MFDRTRSSVTNGLWAKLRDMMSQFQSLREKILTDHKDYYNATGEVPSKEVIEKLVLGNGKIYFQRGWDQLGLDNREA